MAKHDKKTTNNFERTSPPARSLENRENQLIALAYDKVEERIKNGTATGQEYVHFLRMGAAKAQLEKKKLAAETKLLESKKDAIESAKQNGIKYQEAIDAFREYSGQNDD